jgi:hypothetical protein
MEFFFSFGDNFTYGRNVVYEVGRAMIYFIGCCVVGYLMWELKRNWGKNASI